jgi:Domain of unknown function (DUF1990)
VMLLEARFLIFRFLFGVRVTAVTDETREMPTGPERVWGYSYATLEGHFERGQITFTVLKNLRTGRVVFRIDAFSQTGSIRNPMYRLGFWLFGRRLQRRFATASLERVQRFVREALERGDSRSASAEPETIQPETIQPEIRSEGLRSVPVKSVATDPEVCQRLEDIVEVHP